MSLSACGGEGGGRASAPLPAFAAVETAPAGTGGEPLGDPALFIAPDPRASLVLGADAQAGLHLYGLDGIEKGFVQAGRLAGIDVRGDFPFDEREQALIAAADRSNKALALFILDPERATVARPEGGAIPLDIEDPVGACIHRDADGVFYAGITGGSGAFRQFRVSAAAGGVAAEEVRRFDVDAPAGSCVVDDRSGAMFLAAATVGVWRYDAAPAGGASRVLFASVGETLAPDVSSVAIYSGRSGPGVLLAAAPSSPEISAFALSNAKFLARFDIEGDPEAGTDGVSIPAGVTAVTNAPPDFPDGLLAVQDDGDDSGARTFKLVEWRRVRRMLR